MEVSLLYCVNLEDTPALTYQLGKCYGKFRGIQGTKTRSATELRKFFACTESTNALIVLGVQANKTAAK